MTVFLLDTCVTFVHSAGKAVDKILVKYHEGGRQLTDRILVHCGLSILRSHQRVALYLKTNFQVLGNDLLGLNCHLSHGNE